MTAPTFFLLVDAIPFELAHEVWGRGGLPGFAEPRPTVSVFPSLTEVAVPALLRGIFPHRPPGYEVRYYHPPSGEVRGGFSDPESEAAVSPYRARPRGMLDQAAIYLLRGRLAYAQIRWITHRFRQEGGPWLGYLSATDGVAHFTGRDGLERAFRDIAATVDEARRRHRREQGELPGVVLCSDHGMEFGRLHHLPARALAERLARAGFDPDGRGADRAVLVPHGEVGAGVVHAAPDRAPEVARVVAGAPGVDLAFACRADGFLVFRGDGAGGASCSRVRWRGGAYRYEPAEGDCLCYAELWSPLAEETDGWVGDRELFAASWRHAYPDALARVRRAGDDLVRYPAAVLFSMQSGWTYGPALTHAAARLVGGQVGTHGSLGAAQSLGFAAVTDDFADPWPGAAALRPEEVFRPWLALVRAGGAEPG